ncbi:MAG: ATP-binding protein, partial [Verrucomicrobiales bacterium]|nr:ATP-binding protein [Verrucomicrobiales bacterium]
AGSVWVWWSATVAMRFHTQSQGALQTGASPVSDQSGPSDVSAPPAHTTDTRMLRDLGRWQLATTGAVALGGVALALIFFRQTRRQTRQLAAREAEWQEVLGQLRAEAAAKDQAAARALLETEQLRKELAEMARTRATLEVELEHRRQAEQSLSRQRQELARTKELLEVHVRARTQELQKLQRRSELILNAAADGICGFDLNGKITFANPAAARILGLSVAQMVGESAEKLFPAFKPNPTADAASGGAPQPLEVVAPRPDGSVFAAEYVRSPIHENDRVVGEVLVFKDITERKRAAELLAQRLEELTRSNAELEQFAFVASHDLQEPLRKIQAFGDRLKAKCDEVGLEAGRDYLERMQNAAARMQRLINDLLTFSRVISRAQPFAPVDLNAVAREVLGDLEVAIEKSGAHIQVGPLPTIEGDAMQLRQLFQNLIGNALKFQPPGATPHVRIEGRVVLQPSGRGDTAILCGRAADGGTVTLGEEFCELTVQDNGIGFDEKYLDKIFAVFTRLHGRQEYEGTGIGLAVCRRIVERHGGSITARSQPGQGATFIVRLPMRQPKPKATA